MILATRGSRLALAQTEIVKRKLEELGESVGLLIVSTKGDKDRRSELTRIGGDGLFIRELERAVLEGRADVAVHSAKDLPYELMEGLTVASVPDEADPRDVIVTRGGELHELMTLIRASKGRAGDMPRDTAKAEHMRDGGFLEISWTACSGGTDTDKSRMSTIVIGTGSPRRKSELERLLGLDIVVTAGCVASSDICDKDRAGESFCDDKSVIHGNGGFNSNYPLRIEFKSIRGNVDTRLKKLADGEYDAIILAKAGLDRLGCGLMTDPDKNGVDMGSFRASPYSNDTAADKNISEYVFDFYVMSTDELMPAPCQGLIAAECRTDDERTAKLLYAINDEHAMKRFRLERYAFGLYKADCSMPIGIHAEISEKESVINVVTDRERKKIFVRD